MYENQNGFDLSKCVQNKVEELTFMLVISPTDNPGFIAEHFAQIETSRSSGNGKVHLGHVLLDIIVSTR